MGEYNARLQRALLRDRHDDCVKPRSIYDKIEEAACWIFRDHSGGGAVRIENRGRIPAGNTRVAGGVLPPTIDSTIDYRVADRVVHRGHNATYSRERREKKLLQDKKGQSIKS